MTTEVITTVHSATFCVVNEAREGCIGGVPGASGCVLVMTMPVAEPRGLTDPMAVPAMPVAVPVVFIATACRHKGIGTKQHSTYMVR